jgi:hypothetical protein
MSPQEVDKRLNALYDGWLSNFDPLYEALDELRRLMRIRIFDSTGKHQNTAGQTIPLPARRGGDYTTPYSPGYTPKKKIRKNPLELTGFLVRNFSNEPILQQGLTAALMLEEREYLKAQGLQFGKAVNPVYVSFGGYGVIFIPTEEEEQEFLRLHTELIIAAINKQLGA